MFDSLIQWCRQAADSDFVRKVAETQAARMALFVIGLVTSVLVARILGPEGRGQLAVAITISAIGAQLLNFGLAASNTYYVARDRSLLPALVGNSVLIGLLLGGLAVVTCLVFFTLFSGLAPLKGMLLILALATIPFGLTNLFLQKLLLGIQEIRAYNVIEIGAKFLGVGLIVVLILFNRVTVATVFSVTWAAVLGGMAAAFWHLWGYFDRFPRPSVALFGNTLRYGLKAYLAAFCSFLVLRIDVLMIKYMLNAEQVGYYTIATGMADMIYMMPVVVGTIMFPKLSAMTTEKKKWHSTRKVLFVLSVLMVFVVALAALLAEPVIRLLYGKAFLPAVAPFVWLMPAIFALSINTIFMNYFASVGMPPIAVYSPMIAASFNIILNTKMIPLYGIIGAAISSIFSYALMLCASLIYVSFVQKNRILL